MRHPKGLGLGLAAGMWLSLQWVGFDWLVG